MIRVGGDMTPDLTKLGGIELSVQRSGGLSASLLKIGGLSLGLERGGGMDARLSPVCMPGVWMMLLADCDGVWLRDCDQKYLFASF